MLRIMRPPRVTKETSKYFDAPLSTVVPRRSTRSSTLARFAWAGANDSPAPGPSNSNDVPEVALGSDIEDAVKPRPARKRKRTETVTQSTPRRVSARTAKVEVKTEIKSEAKLEIKSEEPSSDDEKPETKPKPRGRVRKPARKVTDAATGAVTVTPPTDWEEIYNMVKEMRLTGPAANAAVDTMGCERLALPSASARDRRFHTLVALMLSSQTKDTVNAAAMARLQNELPPHEPGAPPGLNLENMLAVDPVLLNELIGKVGFHNNKTKYAQPFSSPTPKDPPTNPPPPLSRYLKTTATILQSDFNSDIPPTIAGLTSLPGVGPKMAHLCMSAPNGWNRVEGIGVDVHVHRITNLWGWQSPASRNPEETRAALESWLPRDKWREVNWLLVGLGQSVCLPVGRRCGDCEVGLRGLCKSADRGKVAEGRRRRAEGEGVKREVKLEREVEMEVEGGVIGDVKEEVKETVEEEVKEEVKGAVEEDVKGEDVEGEVKSQVKSQVKKEEVKGEVKDEAIKVEGERVVVRAKKEKTEEKTAAGVKKEGEAVADEAADKARLGSPQVKEEEL